jgi:hypothetical protein
MANLQFTTSIETDWTFSLSLHKKSSPRFLIFSPKSFPRNAGFVDNELILKWLQKSAHHETRT